MHPAIHTRLAYRHDAKIIKAETSGHSLVIEYDTAKSLPDNHIEAARALARQLQWYGTWQSGYGRDTHYYHTLIGELDYQFTITKEPK